MNTAELLSGDERCRRISYWGLDWERARIEAKDLLAAGIREGLTTKRTDYGDAAGERVVAIARDRELVKDTPDVYASVIHLASLADIISCAIRKPQDQPWGVPPPMEVGKGLPWHSSAFLAPSGEFLRRVVLVSSWSKDRHYGEARSWYSLGEVCAYGIPMQAVVVVIGSFRDGKYHSAWSKGLRHPINKGLRFKRKNYIGKGFKESWAEIWREDYDQISTQEWLDKMFDDDIMQDLCFRVDIPVPEEANRQMIVDLAKRKLGRIYSEKELPEQKLSTCDFPIPCIHRNHCHAGQEPSGRFGFVRIES